MVDLGAPKFNMEKLIAQNPDLIITVDKDQVADYQKWHQLFSLIIKIFQE